MAGQLHKRFTDKDVKYLLEKYLSREIGIDYLLEIMDIKRRRFFELLNEYRKSPDTFSVQYSRSSHKKITGELERNIINELKIERELIENKDIPVKWYNYSYIRDQILKKYNQKVSLPTIIDRAKRNSFYFPKKERSIHDHEVLTNYTGELIQHDSSYHRWSPYAEDKWYLITSIDDYSRLLLYAEIVKKETSWRHIESLQSVLMRYGLPLAYYVDSHSIFRFVQGRDSIWREHRKLTDEVTPQWKQVLNECNVKVIYSLSPQAKGKVERPYGWLQDRIVRTCAREGIKTIQQVREALKYEVDRYNNHQVHSTTREVPIMRFEKALKEKRTLFREFTIRPPYESVKDIFCLRVERIVNPYRKISINNLEFKIAGAPIRGKVQLRIVPDMKTGIAEIRFWYENRLIDVQIVKNEDLNLVHF